MSNKDKNEFGYTRFRYCCNNTYCEVHYFIVDVRDEEGDPPKYWPNDIIECPSCEQDSKLIGVKAGGHIKTRGGTRKSDHIEADEGYAKEWYEQEIQNTKEALEFKSGASPYSKYKMDYKELEKRGRVKKVSPDEVRNRKKRSKEASVASEKFIDKVHRNRVGRRSDG